MVQQVALKQFHYQKFTEEDLIQIRYIASSASKFEHPNIVKYVGFCTSKPHVGVVQEFMEKGNLQSYLHGNASISFSEKVRIATEIAKGMVCGFKIFII